MVMTWVQNGFKVSEYLVKIRIYLILTKFDQV